MNISDGVVNEKVISYFQKDNNTLEITVAKSVSFENPEEQPIKTMIPLVAAIGNN